MTNLERNFLEKYYKAANSSLAEYWYEAALAAKQMYNEKRKCSDMFDERLIQEDAMYAEDVSNASN